MGMGEMKGCVWALALALLVATAAEARDRKERDSFRRENPCPVTGKKKGACPGYQVDHIRPLCGGGADSPKNTQWLSEAAHKDKRALTLRAVRPNVALSKLARVNS
jgi:hypothetical protein